MAEQDQWRERPEHGGAIERLETALARIASAAGRRQDALRVAELTARAAQHEADLLLRAEQQRREEAQSIVAAEAAGLEESRRLKLRETADRLDALISGLRSEIQEPPAED